MHPMLEPNSLLKCVGLVQKAALKVPEHGDWWQGTFTVPALVAVLDFVFSDKDRRAWDNNKNWDYHIQIEGALSKEDLMKVSCTICTNRTP